MSTHRSQRRGATHAPFIVAAALLLAAAAGLHPAVAALTERYSKQSIGLRRPLDQFDFSGLASFTPLLGAEAYDVNSESVGTTDWTTMAYRERGANDARSPVMMLLTYYSDPRDRIAHTPEVCYRQGGALVSSMSSMRIPAPQPGAETREIDTRLLYLEANGVEQVLLYTFICNGRFYNDRERVRWALGLPGDRHVYFSKIEVTAVIEDGDDSAAIERCELLLRELAAQMIEEHLPREEEL